MVYIPSDKIKHPNGYHSDPLGFTFIWEGHFLRGIYPGSVEIAKGYFNSGFVNELYEKGLFPKTWISEYENEEFGIIIEHEMLFPNIYSTDWNFSMLRDAAVTVLEVARIGRRYGYNMLDCHKLNIMFKDCNPMYVDMGSFITCSQGTSAWRPYLSFIRSYYSILSLWHSGASQLAKRLMTPGVEFDEFEYNIYKCPLWRGVHPLLKWLIRINTTVQGFAATDTQNIRERLKYRSPFVRNIGLFLKYAINTLKPLKSQRQWSLNRLSKIIAKMKVIDACNIEYDRMRIEALASTVRSSANQIKSVTVFDAPSAESLHQFLTESKIERIIAVNENECDSENVYNGIREMHLPVSCVYFSLNEGKQLLLRERFPEERFKSDIVCIPFYDLLEGKRGVMTADWFVKERIQYSKSGELFLVIKGHRSDFVSQLQKSFKVEVVAGPIYDVLVVRRDLLADCVYYGR